jgi:hypothetical protein
VAEVYRRAHCLTLSITMLFAQPLVFRIIINLGGCGSMGDCFHGHCIVAFKSDFKDDVSFLPLATCGVG